MYSDFFKEFVIQGIDKYFIGTGNPYSKILFIGKESAIAKDNNASKEWYSRNAQDWKNHISNNTSEILEYLVDEKHDLRSSWGKNTWSKYQRLNDYILNREPEKFKVNFLTNIFTTEINDAPEKNTSVADKSSLYNRKLLFKNSSFIQSFPVVVLACSDYIKNNVDVREIDDVFGVTYDGDEKGKRIYSKGNWFFLHHNNDGSKLVIHTRQLSADVNDDLLKDMGIVIREHLMKNGLMK